MTLQRLSVPLPIALALFCKAALANTWYVSSGGRSFEKPTTIIAAPRGHELGSVGAAAMDAAP
jgi:hypothetical protein